jgi:hypothetical protein
MRWLITVSALILLYGCAPSSNGPSRAPKSTADLRSEAIAFYEETEAEKDFDLSKPLSWTYSLSLVPKDRVEQTMTFLGDQGFVDVEPLFDKEHEGFFVIGFSETTVHTADSFASQVGSLAKYARDNGFQLEDWGVGRR